MLRWPPAGMQFTPSLCFGRQWQGASSWWSTGDGLEWGSEVLTLQGLGARLPRLVAGNPHIGFGFGLG